MAASWSRVMLGMDVYEAALARMRYIFDQFPTVVVNSSGGKDSTCVVNLAAQVAAEKDRLPLCVVWLDQEHEFRATVEYQRRLADRPDLNFHWYQVPFRLFNAASPDHQWHNVWDDAPGAEWARPKEPDSHHVNDFGVDRFKLMLDAIGLRHAGPDGVVLTGLRAEESPTRRFGLMTYPAWKWITWGKKPAPPARPYPILHPIFDWRFSDVWHAIALNGWDYCTLYDRMYQYGIGQRNMRVSNYHHETALHALRFLQEVEPDTWNAATKLHGINTIGQAGNDMNVYELPFMFGSWREYRDYLVDHLIPEHQRELFHTKFARFEAQMHWVDPEALAKKCVPTVLACDVEFSKLESVEAMLYQQKAKKEADDRHQRARDAATAPR